jgi:hypothetical protein
MARFGAQTARVPLVALFCLVAACHRVGPAGYGFRGEIVPVHGQMRSVPEALVSDPQTIWDRLNSIEMAAPPAPAEGPSPSRDRAIWDARLSRIPSTAEYLVTLQCGESGPYLHYDSASGHAGVTLLDVSAFEAAKMELITQDYALVHRILDQMKGSYVVDISKEDWAVPKSLDDRGAKEDEYTVPSGETFHNQNAPVWGLVQVPALNHTKAEAADFLALHYGQMSREDRSLLRSVVQDEARPPQVGNAGSLLLNEAKTWEAYPDEGPLAGILVATIPLRGGVADVCLIGQFSVDRVATSQDSPRGGRNVYGPMSGWYLVRRSDGAVVGRTPAPAWNAPSASLRP